MRLPRLDWSKAIAFCVAKIDRIIRRLENFCKPTPRKPIVSRANDWFGLATIGGNENSICEFCSAILAPIFVERNFECFSFYERVVGYEHVFGVSKLKLVHKVAILELIIFLNLF